MTTFTPTAADITFEEGPHTYWWGLIQVPSVSGILRPLTDEYLMGIPEAILNRKRDLGKAVHRACELLDLGFEIDPETLDDDVNGYLEGYKKFLVDMEPTWGGVERIVFDADRWYAGTLDRCGEVRGAFYIVDIKTSVSLSPAVDVQLTAYSEAAQMGDTHLAALQLHKDGNYTFAEAKQESDVWQSLITLHQFKGRKK